MKIQIIFTKVNFFDVVKNFDLSACACWASLKDNKYEFYFLDYDATKQKKCIITKKMYYLSNKEKTEREKSRLQKYLDRGYTLVSRCEELNKYKLKD